MTELPAKQRLVVLTDIGGDPDDQQSLVRLLVHADQFDIEAIVAMRWDEHMSSDDQLALIHEAVDHYGQVEARLREHGPGFPAASAIHAAVKRGRTSGLTYTNNVAVIEPGNELVGPGLDTEASEHLIAVIDGDDPRPVNISVWGGAADLAQALWKVRDTRSPEAVRRFVAKIRVHATGDQDATGPWIRREFPDLLFILNRDPAGKKWNSAYRGMFLDGDESLTSLDWLKAHVLEDHGPLGAFYPTKTYTGKNKQSALKEGDTPSWLYFLTTGLSDPGQPTWGSWGGRFVPRNGYFNDDEDTVGDVTSYRVTVWRWRPTFQHEFAARMDWCVKPYDQANHPPRPVVNGDDSLNPIHLTARPGETVRLDASASSDPDGQPLHYRWWVYPEAGSYGGRWTLEAADTATPSLQLPGDAPAGELHMILELTDAGDPPLTRYRRVIVTVQP